MKKIFLYASLIVAGAAFSACDEDFTDWANPLSNAQEEALDTLVATVAPLTTETIDRAAVTTDSVDLIQYTGCNLSGANDPIFHKIYVNGQAVPFAQSGSVVRVSVNQLDSVVTASYKSMACATREVPVTTELSVKTADGQSLLAYPATTVSYKTANSIPACHQTVESAYYYVGGYNSWNLSAPTKMDDNGDGSFSVTIEIGDSEWFCFAPQSAVTNNDWSTLFRAQSNGDTRTGGFFGDPGSGYSFCCADGGLYKFTIWPSDYYFEYKPVAKELYYVGDLKGWGEFFPLTQVGDNFEGYYYVYQTDNASTWGFKFTTTADWNNPQYGCGDGEGTLALGGGNCYLPSGMESGFYKLTVNTAALTYSVSPITQISLIGSAVNGDSSWGTDYDLTFDTDKNCWTGTYTMTDGEYKLRANHDWSISWGGPLDALTTQNGSNLSITAGKYSFEFAPNCDGKGTLTVTPAE